METTIYKFEEKNDLYKSVHHNTIYNAARTCIINFYETHPEIEFINAEISISGDDDWNIEIKTLFRCFFEGDRDKTIVNAVWNKADFMEPTLIPSCYPEKGKWYRIPESIVEKIDEKEKKLRAIENELNRLNTEKEMKYTNYIENSECRIL